MKFVLILQTTFSVEWLERESESKRGKSYSALSGRPEVTIASRATADPPITLSRTHQGERLETTIVARATADPPIDRLQITMSGRRAGDKSLWHKQQQTLL